MNWDHLTSLWLRSETNWRRYYLTRNCCFSAFVASAKVHFINALNNNNNNNNNTKVQLHAVHYWVDCLVVGRDAAGAAESTGAGSWTLEAGDATDADEVREGSTGELSRLWIPRVVTGRTGGVPAAVNMAHSHTSFGRSVLVTAFLVILS